MRPKNLLILAALVISFGFARQPQAPSVDAMTFMAAFHAGDAQKYVGGLVQGVGQNFHGMGTSRTPIAPAPGAPPDQPRQFTTAFTQLVTLGKLGSDGKIEPLTSVTDFRAADKDSKTVVLQLTGPDVPRGATDNLPQKIEFSGVYEGKGAWSSRRPENDKTEALNPGNVCEGTPPAQFSVGGANGPTPRAVTARYCVPVLTNAKVK